MSTFLDWSVGPILQIQKTGSQPDVSALQVPGKNGSDEDSDVIQYVK